MNQLNKALKKMFWLQVTRFLDLKGKWIFGKIISQKEILKCFHCFLGFRSEEGYQQVSSLIENHLEEMQNKIEQYFTSLSTQV
jgi:hypothetical protein